MGLLQWLGDRRFKVVAWEAWWVGLERALLAGCYQRIQALQGEPQRGWLSPWIAEPKSLTLLCLACNTLRAHRVS